jgi:hypothetical protein
MPKTAAERKGIQPVIASITANGQSGSITAHLGEAVNFNGVAEAALGNIIRYESNCHNLKDFYCEVNVEEPKARVNTPYTYTFQQPGTYFTVLRVTGDLGGDAEILGGGQRNLARVRVIVGK